MQKKVINSPFLLISACECNDQGTLCNQENGKCFCTTKGISGDHCERCDTANHYHGDPTNHGSCFYDLTIDYQFTFNLSKKEDRHYTQINFKNSPPKPDIDADFTITCSVMAKMNITIKTGKIKRSFYFSLGCIKIIIDLFNNCLSKNSQRGWAANLSWSQLHYVPHSIHKGRT